MRCGSLLFLVVVISVPVFQASADEPNGAATKEEIQKLQGIWQLTTFIDTSETPAPADEFKGRTWEFKGDRLKMSDRKDNPQIFTIDPSKNPKWIDIGVLEGDPLGQGIYKIEGDVLTICIVGASNSGNPTIRPSEFKAKKKQYSLLVLKKVTK